MQARPYYLSATAGQTSILPQRAPKETRCRGRAAPNSNDGSAQIKLEDLGGDGAIRKMAQEPASAFVWSLAPADPAAFQFGSAPPDRNGQPAEGPPAGRANWSCPGKVEGS